MPAPRPTSSASTGTFATKIRVANASRARPTTTTTTSSSFSSTQPQKTMSKISKRMSDRGVWSEEEHDKFLVGIKLYPKGPWKMIAAQVGTRSARQVQTHAQKYYEKVARRLRGLRKDRKKLVRPEHRLDDDMMSLCKVAEFDMSGARLTIGPIGRGLDVQSSLAASQADENAALAQAFASFSPSLSSNSSDVSSPPTKLHGDTASAPTSPMGVDTVSSVKMQDIDGFVLGIEQDDYEEQDGQLQSFMSLLTNNGDVSNSTTYFAFDLGGDCSSTTSDESLGGDDDDDTTSSAGSDDTDSIVDLLDDHYLDYLMEVLDTEDQIDQICQADLSCSSYGFCST